MYCERLSRPSSIICKVFGLLGRRRFLFALDVSPTRVVGIFRSCVQFDCLQTTKIGGVSAHIYVPVGWAGLDLVGGSLSSVLVFFCTVQFLYLSISVFIFYVF